MNPRFRMVVCFFASIHLWAQGDRATSRLDELFEKWERRRALGSGGWAGSRRAGQYEKTLGYADLKASVPVVCSTRLLIGSSQSNSPQRRYSFSRRTANCDWAAPRVILSPACPLLFALNADTGTASGSVCRSFGAGTEIGRAPPRVPSQNGSPSA